VAQSFPLEETRERPIAGARILLADDHHLVRETIAAFLRREGAAEVVEAATLADALQRLGENAAFSLILLDYDMPGMSGLDGIERVQDSCGRAPIVILSGNIAPQQAMKALALGVAGVVTKDFKGRTLLDAVKLVMNGERFVPPFLLRHVLGEDEEEVAWRSPAAAPSHTDGLSEREHDVLALLVEGLSNKEIAARLGVADGTVKNHLHSVFKKLGARSRADAVRLTLQSGH